MSWKTIFLIFFSLLGLAVMGVSLGLILTRPSGSEVSPLAPYIPSEVPLALFVRLPVGEGAKAWSPLSDILSEIPDFQMGISMLWSEPLFSGMDIRLKRDVEPWLGNSLAVCFTRIPAGIFGGAVEPEVPSFLLAVEVRDEAAFLAFLERLRSELEKAGTPLEESTFGRYTLFALPRQNVSFALRDGRVLLLSDADMLKAALEREGKDSLAGSADYRALLAHLPSGGVLQMYFSSMYFSSKGLDLLQRQAATGSVGIPTKASAFTLLMESEGLRIQAVSLIDREALAGVSAEDYWSPNPERALSFLPKESLLVFSDRVPSLEGFWEGVLSALRQVNPSAYRELQGNLEKLSEKGLDMEKDLLRWMGGEIGFFVALSQEEGIPLGENALFMHLGLLVEVRDLEQARLGLKKVEDLLGEAGFSFSDREIGGLTFRVSRIPEESDLTLGYALVDNFLVFALDEASLESLARARSNPGEQVSSAEEFQAVLRFLPGSRTFLTFLNLESLWKTLAATLPDEARRGIGAWLPIAEHFQGLGIASAAGRPWDEVLTGVVFLHIVR